jgi:predicted PurR-regulated permease PerM
VLSLVLTVVFLYMVRTVLTPFLIALVLVYLLNPAVTALTRVRIRGRQMPRFVAVLLVMGALLGGIVVLVSFLVPAVAQEIRPFRAAVSTYYHQVVDDHLPNLVRWLQNAADQAGIAVNVQRAVDDALTLSVGDMDGASLVQEAQHLIAGIFTALFSFLLVFILTLFLLVDVPRLVAGFWQLIPEHQRGVVEALVEALDRDLSGSIRGQLTICLINFVLTTIGLLIVNVKYAVILGLIAGVFSIVPVFGSIVSTVPIVLVSLTVSFVTALKAVLVIIVIHLLEANVLNPKVLGHHVELHPAVILFSIVVAEHFLGPIGLVAGVPIAACLRSLLRFAYAQLVPEAPSEALQEALPEVSRPVLQDVSRPIEPTEREAQQGL